MPPLLNNLFIFVTYLNLVVYVLSNTCLKMLFNENMYKEYIHLYPVCLSMVRLDILF